MERRQCEINGNQWRWEGRKRIRKGGIIKNDRRQGMEKKNGTEGQRKKELQAGRGKKADYKSNEWKVKRNNEHIKKTWIWKGKKSNTNTWW